MKRFATIFLIAILIMGSSFAQEVPCDYKVDILIDNEDFVKEDFKWKIRATKIEGKSTNITGMVIIEELNSHTVKKYKPWLYETISRQKTSAEYLSNLDAGTYKITAEINVECYDLNKSNNLDTRIINLKDKEAVGAADMSIADELYINKTESLEVKSQNIIYKSSKEKSKTLVIMLLLLLSIILNIVLVWRR